MIVVEGPDGSGKTTLIHTLREQLKLPLAPRVVSKDAEAMVDLKQWVEDNVTEGFQEVIFDRHRLFSEPIYGPILRDGFEPGFDDQRWFEYWLDAFYDLNPIVIYCLPSFDTVWANVKNDPDNSVVQDRRTIRAVWGAYANKAATELVLRRGVGVTIYDYTLPDASRSLNNIIRNINVRLASSNFGR